MPCTMTSSSLQCSVIYLQVIFLLGAIEEENIQLQREGRQYGDILQVGRQYRNILHVGRKYGKILQVGRGNNDIQQVRMQSKDIFQVGRQ